MTIQAFFLFIFKILYWVMKREIISKLHSNFELGINQNDNVDFWFARDLQVLLGDVQWRNFLLVIDKAKTACANTKQKVLDYFAEDSKMVDVVDDRVRIGDKKKGGIGSERYELLRFLTIIENNHQNEYS